MTRQDRRVVVGLDPEGRSAVLTDDRALPTIAFPNGIVRQEIWAQEHVPARPGDHGLRKDPTATEPPADGVVVRLITVPPGGAPTGPSELHYDDALHVITMVEGTLEFVLETGVVELATPDTIVLPASMHDLRNPTAEPATFVYTSVQRTPA